MRCACARQEMHKSAGPLAEAWEVACFSSAAPLQTQTPWTDAALRLWTQNLGHWHLNLEQLLASPWPASLEPRLLPVLFFLSYGVLLGDIASTRLALTLDADIDSDIDIDIDIGDFGLSLPDWARRAS